MFEIKDFHKNVFVEGNILFDTDKEVSYVGLVEKTSLSKEQCDYSIKAVPVVVNGEEIACVRNDEINDDRAIYHATGWVTSNVIEIVKINPYHCINSYNNNLLELKEIFELDVDFMKRRVVNRMIYLSILSNYELFMADICITCFLRFDNVKNMIRDLFPNKTDDEIVYFLKKRSYSDFKKLPNFFISTFQISIPYYCFLDKAFVKRNDIAHRYNRNKHNTEHVIINNEEIEELVRETNKFVYELFESIIEKVY